MYLDRDQVLDAFAEVLGDSPEKANQVLIVLFREYTAQNPDGWDDLKRILESASIVECDRVGLVHDKLQELADGNGNAEHPRGFFEDPELQDRYVPVAVADGSAIYQVGEDFYLYPGEDSQVQLWKAVPADGPVYYYDDAASSYGEYGEPLGTPSAASPDDGQSQQDDDAWNRFLADHGPRWDGTEESWPWFRDSFLYHADQNQVSESAQGFIAFAESGDKHQTFKSYGITLPAAKPVHAGGEFSGASWAKKFADPETHSTAGLESGFAKNVDAFIAAMRAAGIHVDIKCTRRTVERCYLLHWSWEIMHNNSSAEHADQDKSRPAGVNIRWAHTKKGTDGRDVLDHEASIKGAKDLYQALGGDAGNTTPPALHSRHVEGKAIDMVTKWTKDSIEIAYQSGQKVKIEAKDGPKTGMNPKLWAVGHSYGVKHLGDLDPTKAKKDPNHWSVDGH